MAAAEFLSRKSHKRQDALDTPHDSDNDSSFRAESDIYGVKSSPSLSDSPQSETERSMRFNGTPKTTRGQSSETEPDRSSHSSQLSRSNSNTEKSNSSLNGSVNVNSSMNKKKNWFNTTYKQKSDEFHRLFKEIPADERLLVDYSCALQRDILVHGRMYITQNWICFRATIIKWETMVVIPTNKICSITKEKTAKVIPNAIQVMTDTDKYFFSSFAGRDKPYLSMFRVWQNRLMGNQLSAQQFWQWVHSLYGPELGLTASDDDYEVADSAPESDTCAGSSRSLLDDSQLTITINGSSDISTLPPISLSTEPITLPDNQSEDYCTTDDDDDDDVSECPVDHEHTGWSVLDLELNYSVDHLFDILFSDNPLLRSFMTDNQRTRDIVFGEWSEADESGYRHRSNKYTIAVNASFGPKTTPAVEKQRYGRESTPGLYYCVDCDSFNDPSLPYGENFYTWNRYCITKLSKHKCRIVVNAQICYKKSITFIVRGIIEKQVKNGVLNYFNPLSRVLLDESSKLNGTCETKKKKKRFRHRTNSVTSRPNRSRATSMASPPSSDSHIELQATSTQHSESQLQQGHYIASMVRVIACLLIFLVGFNLLLFFKLWSIQPQPIHNQQADIHYGPHDLVELLNRQKDLYEYDIKIWKEKLDLSLKTIDQLSDRVNSLQSKFDSIDPKSAPVDSHYTPPTQQKTHTEF